MGIFVLHSVFIHRFRDIDPLTRADCIKELGVWMTKCSSYFLESSYLRYFGWMLSDRAGNVRLQCLKSMNTLMKPAFVSGMRPFIERFKTRIMQIASSEKEINVRLQSVKLCMLMARMGLFDSDEMSKVIVLVLDEDERVRELISPAVAEYYHELVEDSEENGNEFMQLKLFSEMALKIGSAVAQQEKSQQETSRQEYLDTLNVSKISLGSMDMNQIQLENGAESLLAWMRKESHPEKTNIGPNNMEALVTAISESVPIISQLNIVSEVLLSDDDEQSLNSEEEMCLIYALCATLKQPSTGSGRKEKKFFFEMQDCIINTIPTLIKKYSKVFTGPTLLLLKELVSVLGMVKAEWYQERKATESYDELVNLLFELYKSNFYSPLLKELALVITNISKDDPNVENKISEYLNSTMAFVKKAIGKSGAKKSSDAIDKLCSGVAKLYHFSKCFTITDYPWQTGDELLEYFLAAYAADSTDVRLTVLLEKNIEIMAVDLVQRTYGLYKDETLPSDTLFVEQFSRIMKFCEAVVYDNITESTGISFNLAQKLVCLRVLFDLLRFANGQVLTKFPELQPSLAPELERAATDALEQIVYICVFHLDESLADVSDIVLQSFGLDIQRLFAGLVMLSKSNVTNFKSFGKFFCYYGLDLEIEDYFAKTQSMKTFEIFGESWDGICVKAIDLMMDEFSSFVDKIYYSDANASQQLLEVENRVDEISTCIQSSISHVILLITSRLTFSLLSESLLWNQH